MRTPLSILGTASQASGSPPAAETFYFSLTGTDYGNLGDWFMDADLLTAASRLPGISDDVIINNVPNFSPSLTERTYKSIEFTSFVNCSDPYSIPPFFKSPVKFITSSGDITGAPTSLIADLESAGSIAFTNPVSLDTEVHKLAGNWIAAGSMFLSDYYHGDEPLAMPVPSQITCANYTLTGCLDFALPGNATTPNVVTITQNVPNIAATLMVNRCITLTATLNFEDDTGVFVCPDVGDSITTLNLYAGGSFYFAASGTVFDINLLSGHSDGLDYATNLSLFGSARIFDIDITGNLSFETEAQYIEHRIAGGSLTVIGQIYIGGFEHQKFTLYGGIITSTVYDILVYDGTGYNLYDAGATFTLVGRLSYTALWDLTRYSSSNVGSWATGSPPSLTDWSSPTASIEPTWGTE